MWICSARSSPLMPRHCKKTKTLIRIRIQSGKIGEGFFVKTVSPKPAPGNFNVCRNPHFTGRRNEDSGKG